MLGSVTVVMNSTLLSSASTFIASKVMGHRPAGPNSGYQMAIHKMGKYRYASTERMVTSISSKPIPKHIHWGRLDDTICFHPSERFLFEDSTEQPGCLE